jgi:diphosphomevalonate decarboxylase
MLTSSPSLIYWHPATVTVMKAVQKWRTDGLPVYFTLNTGQNIHLICEEKNADEVEKRVKMLAEVQQVIFNRPTEGARIVS